MAGNTTDDAIGRAMENIVDLDILRPKRVCVRLADKEIDVSMIPCGITFEIDAIMREMMKLNPKKAKDGGEDTRKYFDLTIKLCAVFASVGHPEMTEEWFRNNVDAMQLGKMAELVKDALLRSYEGVRVHGKN
jgi:hypothetical protein